MIYLDWAPLFFCAAGVIILIVAFFKGSFKVYRLATKTGEYRIDLRGNYLKYSLTITGNKSKARKVVSAINASIKDYYQEENSVEG